MTNQNVIHYCRYIDGGQVSYGILEGDRVREVRGDPFEGYEPTGRVQALDAVKIEVPVVPRTFYCAGLNYVEHVQEQAAKRGEAPNIPTPE